MDDKIEKDDGTFKEVDEGVIARAILDGLSVLIITPKKEWARRLFDAWVVEISANPPAGITHVARHVEMHIAFSNKAVMQVAIVNSMREAAPFKGQRFDVLHAVMFKTEEQKLLAGIVKAMVTRQVQ